MASSFPQNLCFVVVFFLFRCLENFVGGQFYHKSRKPEMNQANVGGFWIPGNGIHHRESWGKDPNSGMSKAQKSLKALARRGI